MPRRLSNARLTLPWWLMLAALLGCAGIAGATPANKAALVKHYDTFLAKAMNSCTTCHLPSDKKNPETLEEFPHNAFGDRLRKLGEESQKAGRKLDIPHRLAEIAGEDADNDGVPNETELLLGHNAGDPKDLPTPEDLAEGTSKLAEFAKVLSAYRWQPFEKVKQPPVPVLKSPTLTIRNPIDAFIAAGHEKHKLTPRPETSPSLLLRRVHLDLTGLAPTPEEMAAFLADTRPGAYERAVDRLLDSPAHGERWARHWMDVWRYSDWTGYQGVPRDSMPHIWRWRDWIIESLNSDKGYDQMLREMLAADELLPTDENAIRATGFLARNFKANFREKTFEDMIGHTFQAFQGVTMNCAKCHDHMYDPISQREYFEVRAIFAPHGFRTDRVPGQVNTDKTGDGLARVFDNALEAKTYILARGDERKPLKQEVIAPNIPRIFGASYEPRPVKLPLLAVRPDKREFIIKEDLARSEAIYLQAKQLVDDLQAGKPAPPAPKALSRAAAKIAATANARLPQALQALPHAKNLADAERNMHLAQARFIAFKATLEAESLEHKKDSSEWKAAAEKAVEAQRAAAVLESRAALELASAEVKAAEAQMAKNVKGGDGGIVKKSAAELADAKKALAAAEKAVAKAARAQSAPMTTAYEPRKAPGLPETSTGRRSALAQWFASRDNPLTARVAMNHIWARHFGRGIVPTLNEFGRNGQPPSNPQLLDWLAAELMNRGWSMKEMHRLIVTSSAYRMSSTPDAANAALDRDNMHLWRMNSRRMEAEIVRDNVLHVSGALDPAMGGPDIDNLLGLTSKRRTVYLRSAPEKEVEFTKIFDGPNPVECYERPVTVMPHQALALANSELTAEHARILTSKLTATSEKDDAFITTAFTRVLSRPPNVEESRLCADFLQEQSALLSSSTDNKADPSRRARENLVLVLFNHNDFITIR